MAEFRMPSLGADMDEGTLLEWLVKPGDEVNKGDIVAVVDTAKAAVEVECFDSGVVDSLLVQPGECVPVGTPLAVIAPARVPAAAAEPVAAEAVEPTVAAAVVAEPAAAELAEAHVAAEIAVAERPAPAPPSPAAPQPPLAEPPVVASPLVRHLAQQKGVDLRKVHGTGAAGTVTRADVERAAAGRARLRVSPLARRLAAELGADLAAVTGTGAGGAIRAEDVRRYASAKAAEAAYAPAGEAAHEAAPAAAREAPAPAREAPAAAREATAPAREAAAERGVAMRRAIANLMARSKREIPHYYLSSTIDLEKMTAWLRRRNRELPVTARIVPAALLLKAAALAAREVPQLNGFWVDDHFVASEHVHLGVAISFRGGGMVAPAIHDADKLSAGDLMAQLRDLVARAREGRLRGSEMTDSTITITNLGDRGVESVFGVIYPPQVALVGFGKVTSMPCAVDGLLGVRPQVVATLAADHRATDGYTGARYLEAVSRLLQKPEEL
ncbi:MAG: dihydrolipoamide acetyltransferase family protein [Micromonosporaceae bacterium]